MRIQEFHWVKLVLVFPLASGPEDSVSVLGGADASIMVTALPLTKGKHKADCTLQSNHSERKSEKEIPSQVNDCFSENYYD